MKKFREKVFSYLFKAEQKLENALVIMDGEVCEDAIPLLYKSTDMVLRILVSLKQDPSSDYQKNIQILKKEFKKEEFLNKENLEFLESLPKMNDRFHKEMELSYADSEMVDSFRKTERFHKQVRKFLKDQLTTKKEKKAKKRIRDLSIGTGVLAALAGAVFLIAAFVQSLTGPQNGLLAHYYDNPDLQGDPEVERIEKNINFKWGGNSPYPQINRHFSARWRGKIEIDKDGDYVFTIESDEGVRLWIDRKSLIDTWLMKDRPNNSSAQVYLEKGRHEIRLEYFFDQRHASLKLLWSSPFSPDKIVKSKFLFPPGKEGEAK